MTRKATTPLVVSIVTLYSPTGQRHGELCHTAGIAVGGVAGDHASDALGRQAPVEPDTGVDVIGQDPHAVPPPHP